MAEASRITGEYVRLSGMQHGVLTLGQLVAVGLSETAIHKRASGGHLHRIHVGVYAIVPASLLSLKARYLAAVLACGPGAVLSHRSAADLHGLRATARAGIDGMVPGTASHDRPGIDAHSSVTLTAAATIVADAIPITTVARTALDLAAVVPRRTVERALDQAEILEVFDLGALTDQLDRNPRHPGAAVLKSVLDEHAVGSTETWSELEELALEATRTAGVPPPEVNAWVDPGDGEPPMRIDFVWRAQRVTLEVDSRRYHQTGRAFDGDRRRDQRMFRAGWRPLRVTFRQLKRERPRIEGLLVGLLMPA
jgi:hypothetical protein